MGRMHPYYCPHGKRIDGGSFFDSDENEHCDECFRAGPVGQRDEKIVALEARGRELEDELAHANARIAELESPKPDFDPDTESDLADATEQFLGGMGERLE